jgi:trehalose-6-phosphate synthase
LRSTPRPMLCVVSPTRDAVIIQTLCSTCKSREAQTTVKFLAEMQCNYKPSNSSRVEYMSIHFLYKSVNTHELVALYAASNALRRVSHPLMRPTDSLTTAAGFDTLRHLVGLVRRLTTLPTQRLDYIKGMPQKLHASEVFLSVNPL